MCIKLHSSAADTRAAQRLHFRKLANFWPLVLSAALLAGCAQRYDMVMTDGSRITNVTRPVFDRHNGVYTYKDIKGVEHHKNSGHVAEIKPHSSKSTTPGVIMPK